MSRPTDITDRLPPDTKPNPDYRNLVRAGTIRPGDFLWFAAAVVVAVQLIPGDDNDVPMVRVTARRGARGPEHVTIWRRTTPVWVRTPRDGT